MPVNYGSTTTPKGRNVYRTESTGEVTDVHAREYSQKVTKEAIGLPLLAVIRRGVDMSAAARKEFSSINAGTGDQAIGVMAFVVESAPLRVMMSFIFKVIGMTPKMFSEETEALAFIDAELDRQTAQ